MPERLRELEKAWVRWRDRLIHPFPALREARPEFKNFYAEMKKFFLEKVDLGSRLPPSRIRMGTPSL